MKGMKNLIVHMYYKLVFSLVLKIEILIDRIAQYIFLRCGQKRYSDKTNPSFRAHKGSDAKKNNIVANLKKGTSKLVLQYFIVEQIFLSFPSRCDCYLGRVSLLRKISRNVLYVFVWKKIYMYVKTM